MSNNPEDYAVGKDDPGEGIPEPGADGKNLLHMGKVLRMMPEETGCLQSEWKIMTSGSHTTRKCRTESNNPAISGRNIKGMTAKMVRMEQ